MKVVDLLKISCSNLKMLYKNGIEVKDVLYLDLYDDFQKLKSEGLKTSYAVLSLSEKYKICERKVYKILKRFGSDCQIRTP